MPFQKKILINKIDLRAFEFLLLCRQREIEARIVGGCVRDAFIDGIADFTNQDIDVAIACPPLKVIELCKTYKIQVIPTGIDHGTLTLIYKGLKMEVTSLRSDIKTDGRRAMVSFGSSFEEDAKRRDFTFNALYLDCEGALYDPFDGISDLKAGRVRFIGSPFERLQEDCLRLWRYFRFSVLYGVGRADLSILPPIDSFKSRLSMVSMERVLKELSNILSSENNIDVLKAMNIYGLFDYTFGMNGNISMVKALRDYELLTSLNISEIAYLSALFTNESMFSLELPLSRVQKRHFLALNKIMDYHKNLDKPEDFFIGCMHSDYWIDAIGLLWSRKKFDLEPYYLQVMPNFPFEAKELIKMGQSQGEAIGMTLNQIKAAWIQSKFTMTHTECLLLAKEILDLRDHLSNT